MMSPWPEYNLTGAFRKAGLSLLLVVSTAQGGNLVLESGPGSAGDLTWSTLDLNLEARSDQTVAWQVVLDGLALPDGELKLGRLEASCRNGTLGPEWPRCADGRLTWHWPEGPALEGRFQLHSGPRLVLRLESPGMDIELTLPDGEPRITASMADGDLGELAGPLAEILDLAFLDGRVDLDARYESGRLKVELGLDGVAFDNADGSLAGEGVRLEAMLDIVPGDEALGFDLDLTQRSGDLLFGPAYLPSPEDPVRLKARGDWRDGRLAIARWSIDDDGILMASGSLVADFSDESPVVRELEVADLDLRLPVAQQRYLNGILAAWSLDDLETSGRVRGRGRWREGLVTELSLDLEDLLIADPAGRLGIAGLGGNLRFDEQDEHTPERLEVSLDWDGAELYRLPLGPSVLRLESRGEDLQLTQPLFFPLLDGGFRVEGMQWLGWRGDLPRLDIQANLEPLDFARLTVALGLPELGGTLAGSFPEIRYEEGILSFGGGFDIQAFSGIIEVREVTVERPFGTLPVVAANIGFDRLDLLEVTGAFGFGRMLGRLDGRVDRLRMLDWSPVAFDARIMTRDDAPTRRISQRAVNNLSSLGGSGAAALTGPILAFFEDFPYRRAGLTCRLSNNICHMGGVADHADGGFIILEGRALPRLDIIGHRRLVNWPLLLAQLQSVTEAEIR